MFRVNCILALICVSWAEDNVDVLQVTSTDMMSTESSTQTGYYYYDDSDGQKWLANMTFSIAGLDYSKIMASGPLHFGVLWNIKSEIASGFGVPFENVSIFLSDGGTLNIAAVVVGPWMTKLDPTPDDIDIHLLDRMKAIPDIDSAKKDGFVGDIRLSVSVRRHDDGLWTTTTTTTSDGRRRRSPATHAPTAAPNLCMAPYTGHNVVAGGQNTAVGVQVEFACANNAAGFNTKYPQTGKVECDASSGIPTWKPASSGTGVRNWGCGGENDCWELPEATRPNGVTTYPQTGYSVPATLTGGFQTNPNTPGSVTAPYPPVAPLAQWCPAPTSGTITGACCSTAGSVLRWGHSDNAASGTDLPPLTGAAPATGSPSPTYHPTCMATGGTYLVPTATSTNTASLGAGNGDNFYCQQPAR